MQPLVYAWTHIRLVLNDAGMARKKAFGQNRGPFCWHKRRAVRRHPWCVSSGCGAPALNAQVTGLHLMHPKRPHHGLRLHAPRSVSGTRFGAGQKPDWRGSKFFKSLASVRRELWPVGVHG